MAARDGVSVVLPVHNAGSYLAPAVKSILEQKDVEVELILVDDHSNDDAVHQLQDDHRLNIFKSPGRGIVQALNHGIEKAKFPFVARMDADDLAHPDRLKLQMALFRSQPEIDICGTLVEIFSDLQLQQGYRHYQTWINAQVNHQQISNAMFVESPIPHPSAMFRKALWDELGGYHESKWPEDYDFWCRAFLASKQFAKPENIRLLRWRDHGRRLSRTDDRYNKEMFMRCKAYYLAQYLSSVYQAHNKLNVSIWGTGPTGLKLHDYLIEYSSTHAISIDSFYDINSKMRGREKRQKPVYVVEIGNSRDSLAMDRFKQTGNLLLVAVGARGARSEMNQYLSFCGLEIGVDYILMA